MTQSSKLTPLKTVIIVQSRMSSSRLPGKCMKKVLRKPLLSYLIERLRLVKTSDEVVVATTTNPLDQPIVDLASSMNCNVFRGSEEDVLDRYFLAAKQYGADVIVRITGDCPLIDPEIVDRVIAFFKEHYPSYHYVSNTLERTFPRGMDVEVFSFQALKKAANLAKLPEEREHVTPYLYRHPELFPQSNIAHTPNLSQHRWTVDTKEDFKLIRHLLEELYPKSAHFDLDDILQTIKQHPDWAQINAHIPQKTLDRNFKGN